MKRINKILWHGNEIPLPSAYEGSLSGLNRGELYIYENDEDPAIFIKTNKNKVKRIGGSGGNADINEILDLIDQKLNGYATEEWVSSTYATKTALSTLSSSVNSLRTDFDNLNALLNDDVTGKINTWYEVVDFLDEYSGSQDLAAILSGMNTDIASRVEKSKFSDYFATEMAKWFVKDDTNKGLKPANSYGLYSETYVSAKGVNTGTGGSGGGSSYNRLDMWSDYTSDKAGWVLSALLGQDLNSRVASLESGSALSVTTSGSGNAVTGVSKSGNQLVITKGATFQSLITSSNKLAYSLISGTPTSLPASDVAAWAKAASKPSYAFSEITNKPTTLGGYGITDAYTATTIDSKLGGYLSLSGGTITGGFGIHRNNTTENPNIALSNNNGTAWLGYNVDADSWFVTNKNWFNTYTLIHSGNIGSQSVASAANLTTPRSIWGQSFDGSSDVSGHMTLTTGFDAGGVNMFIVSDKVYVGSKWYNSVWKGVSHSFEVGDSTQLVINSYGNVLIGTTADNGAKLQVVGSVVASGSVTAKSSSDYRLKCEFDYDVDYQERLLSLGKVCDFNYTPHAQAREFAFADDKRHTSVIWQDARKANITGFCSVEEDGYGTVNPLSSDLIFTMVGAIQQGITKTEKIEERVVRLEKENAALRKEINDMKGGRYGC